MAEFKIECYGIFKRLAQSESLTLNIESNEIRVSELIEELQARYPEMTDTLQVTACAIGDELVTRDTSITADKTLALIPPVSGGQ